MSQKSDKSAKKLSYPLAKEEIVWQTCKFSKSMELLIKLLLICVTYWLILFICGYLRRQDANGNDSNNDNESSPNDQSGDPPAQAIDILSLAEGGYAEKNTAIEQKIRSQIEQQLITKRFMSVMHSKQNTDTTEPAEDFTCSSSNTDNSITSETIERMSSDHEKGESSSIVQLSPTKPVLISTASNATDGVDSSICQICMEEYKIGEELSYSPNVNCKHSFHTQCISDWLLTQLHKADISSNSDNYNPKTAATCPFCRRDFLVQVSSKRGEDDEEMNENSI